MTAPAPLTDWQALESPLSPSPRFHVQAPDGRRDWAERGRGGRQEVFVAELRKRARGVLFHHVSNEGKRFAPSAQRSGIRGGVFDNQVFGTFPLAAAVELKGYSKAGQAGKLSDAQVEWGNAMIELGWNVACFFCPYAAVEWLRENGFPVAAGRVA